MNKSLNIWVSSTSLSDGNWHMNVRIFKVLLLLMVDMGSNNVHDGVLISDNVG